MDEGKMQIFEERRKEKSNEVKLVFIDPFNFNVVDEEGNMKYVGNLEKFECTCPSYFHNNNEKYTSSHPEPFLCKHLMAGKRIRYG